MRGLARGAGRDPMVFENTEVKFWRWQCKGCGHETVMPIAGKLPRMCTATYGCFGTEFLKVGEGPTEEEAKRKV
jgi:hypothetical protein